MTGIAFYVMVMGLNLNNNASAASQLKIHASEAGSNYILLMLHVSCISKQFRLMEDKRLQFQVIYNEINKKCASSQEQPTDANISSILVQCTITDLRCE